MRQTIHLILAILLATGLFCDNAVARERVLVLGAIHDDPKTKYEELRPVADYVQQALREKGVASVEVLIVPDRSEMISLLRDGRIDWVSETPFGAAYLNASANTRFLARRWKDGQPNYSSVFFARNDSGINNIENLRNSIIAFEHRNSTSGFYIPASIMTNLELPLDKLATPRERPKQDTFGYIYSGNEYNTVMWVHKGLVDAGVLSDSDWENEELIPAELRKDMRVFRISGQLPRAVELVRSNLDPGLRESLLSVLLGMHEAPDAADALAGYDQTARFDELDEEHLEALSTVVAELPAFSVMFP